MGRKTLSSEEASRIASIRQSKLTKEQRVANSVKMNEGKKLKNKLLNKK